MSKESHIQQKIDGKIKPLGSLGKIESLAKQVALLQQQDTLTLTAPQLIIFAADHGVAKHNISIAPQQVTSLMVESFLHGRAAINSFIAHQPWHLNIVDCGIKYPVEDSRIINCRLGSESADISFEPALSDVQMEQAQQHAVQLSNRFTDSDVIALGEMGIANTTSATAIYCKLFNFKVTDIVGAGTGINTQQLSVKQRIIEQAIQRCSDSAPLGILKQLGGFEIATMVFSLLEFAKQKKLLIIDGFIVTAAAAIALQINPNIRANLVFAHCSSERGHRVILNHLNVEPLLDLDLRLGEGTGAALTLPLLQAAIDMYNNMASFEQLGISL